jgi:hypothetical protein
MSIKKLQTTPSSKYVVDEKCPQLFWLFLMEFSKTFEDKNASNHFQLTQYKVDKRSPIKKPG